MRDDIEMISRLPGAPTYKSLCPILEKSHNAARWQQRLLCLAHIPNRKQERDPGNTLQRKTFSSACAKRSTFSSLAKGGKRSERGGKSWQKVSLQRRWQEREGKLAQLLGLEKGPIYAPLHITHQSARSNSHQSHLNCESRLTTLVTGEQGGVHIVAKLTGFPLCDVIGRCPVHHHEDGDPHTI